MQNRWQQQQPQIQQTPPNVVQYQQIVPAAGQPPLQYAPQSQQQQLPLAFTVLPQPVAPPPPPPHVVQPSPQVILSTAGSQGAQLLQQIPQQQPQPILVSQPQQIVFQQQQQLQQQPQYFVQQQQPQLQILPPVGFQQAVQAPPPAPPLQVSVLNSQPMGGGAIHPPQQHVLKQYPAATVESSSFSRPTNNTRSTLTSTSPAQSLTGSAGVQPDLHIVALPNPEALSSQDPSAPLPPISNPNEQPPDSGKGRWEVLTMSTICKEFLSGRCKHLTDPANPDGEQLHSCIYVHLPQHIRAFPQEVCRDYTKPTTSVAEQQKNSILLHQQDTTATSGSGQDATTTNANGCRRSHCRMFHGSQSELEKARSMLTRYGLNPNSVFVRQPEKRDPEHLRALNPNERPRLSYQVSTLQDCVLIYARKKHAIE